MSHEVETMAYTNEVPWHGLGVYIKEAPTVDAMLKLAGLNWEVNRKPIFTQNGKLHEVKGFAALERSTDHAVLDIVGSKYVPTQNKDAFSFFKEFVEAGGAKMETAGSLRGGRQVWGLAALGNTFKMKGNDVVKGYLLCVCPHEQGKSLMYKMVAERVVCANTMAIALREKGSEWRMAHRSEFAEVKQEEAKQALGIARETLGEFERNARVLQKLNLSRQDAIEILAPIYQPATEKLATRDVLRDFDANANKRMKQLIDAYENAPGAQPGNGWGLFNAVTYYADHLASRTADKRLSNAWMGKTAAQKERVLVELLERV